MTKENNKPKTPAKDLVDSMTVASNAIKSFGQAMGKAVVEAGRFSRAAHRVGSAVDRDRRQGKVDELFTKDDARVGRGSMRRSITKRRADSLLDDVDPSVDNEDQERWKRVAETAGEVSRSMGITAQEASDVIAAGMRADIAGASPSPQRPAPVATGDQNVIVKEERCKIGQRRLREDDTTE